MTVLDLFRLDGQAALVTGGDKGLGQGIPPADLLNDRRTVAEGASTAPVLAEAARAAGVDMPIVDAVCALLTGTAKVDDVVKALLARPLKQEGR